MKIYQHLNKAVMKSLSEELITAILVNMRHMRPLGLAIVEWESLAPGYC